MGVIEENEFWDEDGSLRWSPESHAFFSDPDRNLKLEQNSIP